jgi:hypothetical protein
MLHSRKNDTLEAQNVAHTIFAHTQELQWHDRVFARAESLPQDRY